MTHRRRLTPLTALGGALILFALTFDAWFPSAEPGVGLRQWLGVVVGLYLVAFDLRRLLWPARWHWDLLLVAPYFAVLLLSLLAPGEAVQWHRPAFLGFGHFSARDALINVAAFVPLGLSLAPLAVKLGRLRAPYAPVAAVAAIGFLFSLAVESAQYWWIAGRYSSASDLVANTLGVAAGGALFALCRERGGGRGRLSASNR